jgi:hypothetical protein
LVDFFGSLAVLVFGRSYGSVPVAVATLFSLRSTHTRPAHTAEQLRSGCCRSNSTCGTGPYPPNGRMGHVHATYLSTGDASGVSNLVQHVANLSVCNLERFGSDRTKNIFLAIFSKSSKCTPLTEKHVLDTCFRACGIYTVRVPLIRVTILERQTGGEYESLITQTRNERSLHSSLPKLVDFTKKRSSALE